MILERPARVPFPKGRALDSPVSVKRTLQELIGLNEVWRVRFWLSAECECSGSLGTENTRLIHMRDNYINIYIVIGLLRVQGSSTISPSFSAGITPDRNNNTLHSVTSSRLYEYMSVHISVSVDQNSFSLHLTSVLAPGVQERVTRCRRGERVEVRGQETMV